MVWAVQIWVHGEWRTTSVHMRQESVGEARVKTANAFGCMARVQTFHSQREAWA